MSSSDPDDAAILPPVPDAPVVDDAGALPKRRPRRRKPDASEAVAASVSSTDAATASEAVDVPAVPPLVVPVVQAEPMAQAEDRANDWGRTCCPLMTAGRRQLRINNAALLIGWRKCC